MFFSKRRLQEDEARIRQANLPEKHPPEPQEPPPAPEDRIGVKDVFAMILAVFSLILPYVLGFVVLFGLIVWAIWAWL